MRAARFGGGAAGGDNELEDEFNFQFDFDDDGNMVDKSKPRVRQRKQKIAVMAPDGTQVAPASSFDTGGAAAIGLGGFGGGGVAAPVHAPEELVDKINAVTKKLEYYRRKIKTMKDREEQHRSEFLKLAARAEELENQLDEERDHNVDDLAGVRGRAHMVEGMAARRGDAGNRQRRDATRQLYTGFDLLEAEGETDDVKNLSWGQRLARRLTRFMKELYPLSKDVRQVEARFGSSVYSYFSFFRWLVLQSLLASLIAGGFFVVHVSKGSFGWGNRVGSYMPEVFAVSSFVPNEATDYVAILLFTHVVLVAVGFRKWIKEDFLGKVATMFDEDEDDQDDQDPLEKERKKKKFAKLLLNAWDHTRLDTEDLKSAIGQNVLLIQHEDLMLENMTSRTWKQRVVVYTRRVIGMIMSAAILVAAGYIIGLLTVTSSSLEKSIAETDFSPFAAFIVPAAVSLINAIQPPLIIGISKFEQWDDPGRQVKFTVWRLFIAKLLNVLLQVVSFSLLADPLLLRGRSFGFDDVTLMRSVRTNLEKGFVPTTDTVIGYTCRADQAGLGLLQLVLAEFIFSKVLAIVFPYFFMGLAAVKARIFKALGKPTKHYVRPQFDVAKKMVSLLYFTQLSLMALPLNPFGSVANAVFFFINFKFETFTLRKYFVKPVKPWSAKDAGAFFVKFYLLSLFVALLGLALLLTNKSFPKTCTAYDAVVVSNYDGVDPYCSHVDTVSATLQNTADAKDRVSLVEELGGEVVYWLEMKCPGQCQTLYPAMSAAECKVKCDDVTDIVLKCDVTEADVSGKMQSGSLSEPCDFPCGPFVNYENAYAAMVEFFTSGRSTWNLLRLMYVSVQEAAVLWSVCLALLVMWCFKRNAHTALKAASMERQQSLEQLASRYKKKAEKQAKQITALKRAHDEGDVDAA